VNPVPAIAVLVVALVNHDAVVAGVPDVDVAGGRVGRGLLRRSGRQLEALGQVKLEVGTEVDGVEHVDVEAQLKKTGTGNSRGGRGSKKNRLHGDGK
jgi:hypothetical protein